MADISKIKLPSGTTYNIKDSISGYTTNIGTITRVKTTAGAHTTIDVSSGAATFNVPTKTSHLTNDSGFLTAHQTLYEANLNWGGKDFSAGYSPIDAAMIDVLGANRFAFLRAAGLTIEYSTDGGSSYTDYGATDAQKVGLFSSGQSFYLGKHTSNGSCTTNDRLRVTIDTGAANIYTVLNKIAIYISTSGATVQVLIEKALQSTPTTFSIHKDWTGISGWSGWNILNISGLTTYGNTPASQYGRIRFTFRQTAVNTTYSSANISKIMGFGGVGWAVPSTMAATGHLYSYDSSQNATFPAKVTATSFSGPLTGNVTGNVSGTAANVTGTIAIANGGTGQTTAANAINALLNGLPVWTADPTDTTYFVRQDTGGSATYGKVAFSTIWNYISGKLPAWSKASTKPSYNFSEIGSTPTTLSGYGITDAKIASGTITLGSNTITPLTSSSTLSAAKLSGAIPSAVTATTQASTDNSTKIATTAYVTTAIANLPEPMLFKGSVGTGGTVTSLPTAAASNEGWTYKVITALSSPTAKVGDTVISNGSSWVVIPSGDEPSGTVTSVGVSNATNGGLTVSGSPITSSGTITIGHSNVLTSAQTTQAVYPIKIDKNGHISAYGSAVTISTNWLNGSATGSVRTIHSQAEDSNYTIGQYAVAEGAGTKASGVYSHAEGASTIASGGYSHAEGAGTTASGVYSHAEGIGTTASEYASHAEGGQTTASGYHSHAEGYYTIANHNSQHVFGQYNIADPSDASANVRGTYIEIVGNGTDFSTRSNARTLDWSGNEVLAGKLTVGTVGTNSMDVATVGQIPTVPSSTGSATTGITASTTATKTTLGTAFTIPNVTSAGSASSWTFEEKTIPNVTSVGSASTWAFTSKTVVTGVTFTMDTTDTKKLKITTSTDTVYSKSSGSNGTAPTLGTAIKVQSKKSGANGSAPTLGTAFTVPNVTGNTSATVSITDNGHTHTI